MGTELTCYGSAYWARRLDGKEFVLLTDRHGNTLIRYQDENLVVRPYRPGKHADEVYVVGDGLCHMSVAQYGLRPQTKFTIKTKE